MFEHALHSGLGGRGDGVDKLIVSARVIHCLYTFDAYIGRTREQKKDVNHAIEAEELGS
jgi:hypothetical protein